MKLTTIMHGDIICPVCNVNLLVGKTDENGKPNSGMAKCGKCGVLLRVNSYIVYRAEVQK